MKLLSSLVALAMLAACNNAGSNNADHADSSSGRTDSAAVAGTAVPLPASTADTSFAGCYSYIRSRDTVTLHLEPAGTSVAGPLSYNYFEKDLNTGNFTADAAGDTLTGWYLFKSEGMMSVRQEAFLKVGNELWPATGERIERNDSSLFKSSAAQKFDQKLALKKVPCVL